MSLHVRHQFDWWFDRSLLSKRESLPCPVRPDSQARQSGQANRQTVSFPALQLFRPTDWTDRRGQPVSFPFFSSPRLTLNGNGSLDAYLPRYFLMVNGGGGDCRLLTLEKIENFTSLFILFLLFGFSRIELATDCAKTLKSPLHPLFTGQCAVVIARPEKEKTSGVIIPPYHLMNLS